MNRGRTFVVFLKGEELVFSIRRFKSLKSGIFVQFLTVSSFFQNFRGGFNFLDIGTARLTSERDEIPKIRQFGEKREISSYRFDRLEFQLLVSTSNLGN